ncbi:DUF6155 family protein [Flavobacterium phragmitis]|uniref:Uncharacterized protein n=1 Tax=Flavobacterium phragmitis TaxID=739143 RepID=A0A1I1W7I6_9FLAO|nr:DUF6155 family protein [Flavobacterium phragmitis]SFD90979.1 hypothetical protein SAMN05216297_114114 [Flavobacterium phragmitis]
MSKRDLKKYLGELTKEQLEEQLIELYEKFAPVKTYYDFVFNPKEDKLLQEAKVKISQEYFPIKKPGARWRPKAKMRRSVAQKLIKHFMTLGVDSFVLADIMLYNIEIAQTYSSQNYIKQELFYKSMLNSFEQAVNFIVSNGIFSDFKLRINAILEEIVTQKWKNKYDFEAILEKIDY